MKKFVLIMGLVVILIAGCSASSSASTKASISESSNDLVDDTTIEDFVEKISKPFYMRAAVKSLRANVGHTWYVFSGNTPSGWDCSGLTMWFYEQLGVELKHSASVQKNSGVIVDRPKIGDIVAFGWKGYDGAGHVGIYIGDGLMIHAGGGPGDRTNIMKVSDFAKSNWNTLVTYTRIEWYNN
jgi:hypothetical protein